MASYEGKTRVQQKVPWEYIRQAISIMNEEHPRSFRSPRR